MGYLIIALLLLISGCVSNLFKDEISRKVTIKEEAYEEIHFGPMPEPRHVPIGKKNGSE